MSITYEKLASMEAKAYYKNEFYPILKDENGKGSDILILAKCVLKGKKTEDLLTIGCIDPLPDNNAKTRVKCKFDKAEKKVTIYTADKLAVVQRIFEKYATELKNYAVEGEPEKELTEEDIAPMKVKLKEELLKVVNHVKQGYKTLEASIPQEIIDAIKGVGNDMPKAATKGEVQGLFDTLAEEKKLADEDMDRLEHATEITVRCKLQYEIKPSSSAFPVDTGNMTLMGKCELGDRHSGVKMNSPLHQHWNNGGEGISFCYLEIRKEDKAAGKTYTFEVPVIYDHAPTRNDNTYYWKNAAQSSGPSDAFGKVQKKYQALDLDELRKMR